MEPTICSTKTSITFGMFLDGADWSDKPASIGQLRLGPSGMLDFLETRLGLKGPKVHPATRINQYMARMEAADTDAAWFHESFEADPWSTAKQLLAWRDELIDTGWSGEASDRSSNRLQALALLENSKLSLAPGPEDRLQAALQFLNKTESIDIRELELVEEHYSLPPVWQKVIARLEEIGARISVAPEPGTDITNRKDAIVMLEANNEWEAAEAVATWLAADQKANNEVAIVCGAGTRLIDQALAKRGLPILGRGDSSQWRPYLQLLPLVIANLWKPVNIDRLIDLLSLPVSIVKRHDARHLLRALSQDPGIGGEKWQDAFVKIQAEHIQRQLELNPGADIETLEKDAAQYAANIDEILVKNRHSEDEPIPTFFIQDKCCLVECRLRPFINNNTGYGAAVGQSRTLDSLMSGKDKIKKSLLDRMLDTVVESVGDDGCPAQVTPWAVFSQPGHIIEPVQTVFWWGFAESSDSTQTYWTKEERAELSAQGNPIEEHRAFRDREAEMFRRASNLVQGKLVFVYPKQIDGEDSGRHPLWDELMKGIKEEDQPVITAASLRKNGNWEFAGRRSKFIEREREIFKNADEKVSIPKGLYKMPEKISASQMSAMIACPLRWAVQYQAGIRSAPALVAPADHQMKGNLCHKVASVVLNQMGAKLDPKQAREMAKTVYDDMVPQMAMELLSKGRSTENERLRETMAEAIAVLVMELIKRGLTVDSSENEVLEKLTDEISVWGFVDIAATDKNGRRFVIDLKWTGNGGAKKKETEVEEGRALQLATYAWLLKPKDGKLYPGAGYFMLTQGEMVDGKKLDEVWDEGLQSWDKRTAEFNNGQLAAAGIRWEKIKDSEEGKTAYKTNKEMIESYEPEGLMYQEGHCNYCHYTVLCGVTEAAE